MTPQSAIDNAKRIVIKIGSALVTDEQSGTVRENWLSSLAADIGTPEQYAELKRVAAPMLEEWSRTKQAPRHADWLHEIARKEHGNA